MIRVIVLATALVLSAAVAHAQANCAKREIVVEKLGADYGEKFGGGGLQNASRVFEVWFSEEAGTWTILMTRADGVSCIMASGTNWRQADLLPTLGQDG